MEIVGGNMLLVPQTPDAMPDAQKVCRLLRYALTCTKICVRVVAQARPAEASRRLHAERGGGGIAKKYPIFLEIPMHIRFFFNEFKYVIFYFFKFGSVKLS
jgi:hypothetical protein